MAEYVSGEYSPYEVDYIETHWTDSDASIAEHLHRKVESIGAKRREMNLIKKGNRFNPPEERMSRETYIATLDDKERKDFLVKELRETAIYRQIKRILTKDEREFYEEKIVGFQMDPSIKELTTSEKDTLHEMTMAQIRVFRYMREEKTKNKDGNFPNKSREIKECQDTIAKCQESLNVQRRQRLKSQDQYAEEFCQIIRDLKDPITRREAGYEACMLKFIAERSYNQMLEDGTIISGKGPYDLRPLFKDGVVPSGDGYFCGEDPANFQNNKYR